MSSNLTAWAQPQLERLLPLDEQSIREILTYSASLSKEAGADHLKNLLGDSPQALEFISSFNSRRADTIEPTSSSSNTTRESVGRPDDRTNVPGSRKKTSKTSKKGRAPLHNAGPIRRPENYGDTGSGYTKSSTGQDYISQAQSSSTAVPLNASSLSRAPAALQAPFPIQDPVPSRSSSQQGNTAVISRLPPSAAGPLLSDLPNVRSKQSRKPAHHSGTSTPQKTTTTTSNLNDLTSAIATLELSTNPTLSSERRKCECNAFIHPLFETAPNCLSCGKIICALEGLQPCSFCDSPILSKDQVQTMIRALKDERGQGRMAAHNATTTHSSRGSPMYGSGVNTPESSGDELSAAAARARAHRDKLLSYQSENAQRTRVHDEAADYDMTVTPGTTQWMSPVQRAAALKKQQKYLRELDEANKPEWERKKTVMSMSIKNGKLVRTYERAQRDIPTEVKDAEDPNELEQHDEEGMGQTRPGGKLSNNPLLSDGGLIRPVWKGSDGEDGKGKGKGRERAQGQSTWRRVQDDLGDNEQWILDGGVHGYSESGS